MGFFKKLLKKPEWVFTENTVGALSAHKAFSHTLTYLLPMGSLDRRHHWHLHLTEQGRQLKGVPQLGLHLQEGQLDRWLRTPVSVILWQVASSG